MKILQLQKINLEKEILLNILVVNSKTDVDNSNTFKTCGIKNEIKASGKTM